jgi:hypothetical protein
MLQKIAIASMPNENEDLANVAVLPCVPAIGFLNKKRVVF